MRLDRPLGAASDAEWSKFWLDLQDFLELMFQHHVEPSGHFYLNAMDNMTDADSLLTALRNAKLFDVVTATGKLRHARSVRPRPLSLQATFRLESFALLRAPDLSA